MLSGSVVPSCCCLAAPLLATSTWERCSTAVRAARGTRLFTDEAADARWCDHERLCAAAARPVLGMPPAGQAIHAQRFGWQPRNSCGVPSPASRASPPAPIHAPPATARDVRAAARAPLPGSISQRGALLTSRRAYAGVPSSVYHGGTRQTGTVTVRIRSPGSVAGQRTHPIAAHLGQGGSTRSLGAGHTTQI